MIPTLDRRHVMLTGASAMLAAPVIARAQAPAIPAWKTEFRRMAPNVYAFIRGGGPGIDNASMSNAGVIVGPENVTLVDALGPPIHAKELRQAVQSVTEKRVTRIINTHFHRDHTNGDYLFAPAEVVMTPATRDLLQAIPPHPYDTRPEWQDGMGDLKLVMPTTLITNDITYMYGDLEVRVLSPGAAHTFGDLMVYLPQHKLLFAGDVAFFYVSPALHTSNPEHWLEVCDRIQKMDVDVIVPGHGPVGGKRDLAEMVEYVKLMQSEIRRGYDAGKSPGRAAAEARKGRFANWTNQDRWAWAAVRLYADWKGAIRPEQDAAGQEKAIAEYNAIMKNGGR
jgi:cyclase